MIPSDLWAICGCEESQAVCIELRKLGVNAFSCDTEPCSGDHPEWHLQMDVLKAFVGGQLVTQSGQIVYIKKWLLGILFPPCTFLSYAATRHWDAPGREEKRQKAMKFFMKMINVDIKHIAVENPVGYPNTVFRKPDQIIHPWYFGDNDKKRTCLWLKNLPRLQWEKTPNLFFPVTACSEPEPLYINKSGKRIFFSEGSVGKSKDKSEVAKIRSKTFPSIAIAMATQWTEYILSKH